MPASKKRAAPAAKKSARFLKKASKPKSKTAKPPIDKQWKNNGSPEQPVAPSGKNALVTQTESNDLQQEGRTPEGKFAPGHRHGFQPGQSGNPAGRPKYTTVSEAIREQLKELDKTGAHTLAEQIADALIQQCLKGNVKAIKELIDRMEGKARQPIEIVRERQTAEIAIQQLMDRIGCTREKAIELLTPLMPSVAEIA